MLEKNVQALHLNTYAVEHTFLTREDCCTSSLLCLNRESEHKGGESSKYKAHTVLWSSHFQPPNVDFVTRSWETPSFNNSTMQKSWSTTHFFIFFIQEVSLSFFKWSWVIVLEAFNFFLENWLRFSVIFSPVIVPDHNQPIFVCFFSHLTLAYESVKFRKAPNSWDEPVLCLYITDNLAKNQF